MPKHSLVAAVAICALVAAPSTLAQTSISWNYLSASLLVSGELEANGTALDLEQGYGLDAALGIGDHAFFRTRIRNHDFEPDAGGDPDIALDTQQWGVGVHVPFDTALGAISPWASLNYERVGFLGFVADGLGVDVGVRALILGLVEVGLGYKTASVDGGVLDMSYDAWELSLSYNVISNIDILVAIGHVDLDIDFDDDVEIEDVIGLGLRVRF